MWNLITLAVAIVLLFLTLGLELASPVVEADHLAQRIAPQFGVDEARLREELTHALFTGVEGRMVARGLPLCILATLLASRLILEWRLGAHAGSKRKEMVETPRPAERQDSPVNHEELGRAVMYASHERAARQWAAFVHLSILTGFITPLAGLVLPVVLWQVRKAELPELDAHGRNAANWIISYLIYGAVCLVLVYLVRVAIVLLGILAVLGVTFPIIAGIKASKGQAWKYPLAIPFL